MAEITLPSANEPYATITAGGEASPLDVSPDLIVDHYKQHGAILLRGFPVDLESFRLFTEQFCATSVFNESPDRRLLDDAHNIQSVNGGADAFPLHPELSREPWKPDACFFCCLEPPGTGGETTICDGVEIVRQLPEEVRSVFAARRLLYIQAASPELLEFWLDTRAPSDNALRQPPSGCPYSFFRVQGGIIRAFSRPALHAPMFSKSPAFGNFLLFARYLLGKPDFPVFEDGRPVPAALVHAVKETADRLTVAINWRKSDLLMLDNTRFMHGRNAIVKTDERLIASYFGYLRFAVPDAEEPPNAPWRRAAFRPPQAAQRQPLRR